MPKTTMRNFCSRTIATTMLLLATTGCGDKKGTISGKVTFEEMPIPVGTIAFISQNGKVASGTIEQGRYSVTEAEVGPLATVTVMSHPPSPMVHPPTGPADGAPVYPPGQYVPIPDRYADTKRSGLTCDVVEGTQTHDFVLQP